MTSLCRNLRWLPLIALGVSCALNPQPDIPSGSPTGSDGAAEAGKSAMGGASSAIGGSSSRGGAGNAAGGEAAASQGGEQMDVDAGYAAAGQMNGESGAGGDSSVAGALPLY